MGREVKRVKEGAGWMPDLEYKAKKGDWYQMWQTVSDRPYTPAFKTPEELAQWCADHPWGAEVSNPIPYAAWLKFILGPGWAPSMVMDSSGVRSGVLA
jgi:hypothetical protein